MSICQSPAFLVNCVDIIYACMYDKYDIFCQCSAVSYQYLRCAARCIHYTFHIAVLNIATLLNFRFSTCPMPAGRLCKYNTHRRSAASAAPVCWRPSHPNISHWFLVQSQCHCPVQLHCASCPPGPDPHIN